MTELYTVEKIIDKRIVQKGGIQVTEYRVKWLGYREDESTWEPYKNLKYVSDMIEQYELYLKNAATQLSKNIMGIRSPPISKKPLLFYEERIQDEDQNNRMEQQINEGTNIYDRLNEIELQKDDYEEDDYKPRQQTETSKKHKKKGSSTKNSLDRTQSSKEGRKGEERKQPEQEKEKPSNKRPQNRKKRTQLDLINQTPIPATIKQAKQIEERICFNPKTKPYQFNPIRPSAPTGQVTILGLVRGRNNQFEFLTQQGELLSFRSRASLTQHHPDELIRFFESKIDFQKIPKLSL